MYTLTAADFADTGQWRLLLNIGVKGLEAFLENTLHPEIEPQSLCRISWEHEGNNLKKNLEEAVYNNPRVLDDFATRIIIFDPHTLFIPSEIADKTIGAEEEIYKQIYEADDSDIMTDRNKDITAVWSLAPGVKSFLMRTFPGARITCNLMEKVRDLRKKNVGLSLYKFIRDGEIDLILLKDAELLSASTQEVASVADISEKVEKLFEAYDLDPRNVIIKEER